MRSFKDYLLHTNSITNIHYHHYKEVNFLCNISINVAVHQNTAVLQYCEFYRYSDGLIADSYLPDNLWLYHE